ncbi:hypothetical protein V8C37DRAFT_398188 [Trichoderma ceciliae]
MRVFSKQHLVVIEACILEKHVNHFIKRGGLVRLIGEFYTAFAALLGYREVPYYINNPPPLSQYIKEAIMHALKKPLILD